MSTVKRSLVEPVGASAAPSRIGARRSAEQSPSLRSETRALLRRYHLLPKKGLGQSFLIAPTVRDLILGAAQVGPEDLVVEIGPGTGVLTEGLIEKAGWLVAIERDPGLHRVLMDRFRDHPRLSLVCADALVVDYTILLAETFPRSGPAKLVSNLPYSVATPLILRLIRLQRCFSFLLVMVQREVARRLLAAPGGDSYSSLTLRCRYEANTSAVAHVSRTAFYPRPVVDSTLVRLDLLPKPRVSVRSPDLLFRVVRAAFGQRRKTVRNALLGGGIPADSAILDRAFTEAAIDPKRRAETLTLEEFASLADYLHGGLVVPRGPNHVEEEGR